MDFSWLVFFFFLICFSILNLILGDRKHLNDVKKYIQDFYKDLLITIEDIPQKKVLIV